MNNKPEPLVWTTPSRDSSGSMPIGNGDIGLNVWVEKEGDLLFYIGKTDAWDENARLLKLGRVRVSLTPNPFSAGLPFRQELDVATGTIRIQSTVRGVPFTLLLWVDANRPVIRVEANCPQPFELTARLELWRTELRSFGANDWAGSWHMGGLGKGAGLPEHVRCFVTPDAVVEESGERLVWYHRNDYSVWPIGMKLQGLEEVIDELEDPLMHRTFGAAIRGPGLTKQDSRTLQTGAAVTSQLLSIFPLTAMTETAREWMEQLDRSIKSVDGVSLDEAREGHRQWWGVFWDRSGIHISGDDAARDVTRACTLQRWINACGGRGAFPIKFNGSLFTVESHEGDKLTHDADYRRWGGDYWYQNTRLPYHTMLAGGDYDLMRPLFKMYGDTLPLAEARARLWFGCEGAFIPETMCFWGMYSNDDYGWNRDGLRAGDVANRFVRWIWSSGLELAHLMFDFYEHTGDEAFLREKLLPWTEAMLCYFDSRFARDASGRLVITPSQAIETYQSGVVNPVTDIAGLQVVVARLLALPASLLDSSTRSRWEHFRREIPPLPMIERDGKRCLSPAQESDGKRGNCENPELYPVWPFRIYGVGREDLETALNTFSARHEKWCHGWSQDSIQAACLGLAQEARDMVVASVARKHEGSRFPAFWGPNADWVPDQDHGSNILTTVQTMLLQCDGRRLLLFPAWPREWDVEFKLHAPGRTVVECRLKKGKVESLTVTPAERLQDVVNCLNDPGTASA
jgi:alpha-L-fucosidase 2